MLYAEEIGDESFLPATEEFRHAFDHLMRVFGFKLGFKSGTMIMQLYSPPAKIALFIGKVLEHSYIESATF